MKNNRSKLNKNKKLSVVLLILCVLLLNIIPNLIVSKVKSKAITNDKKKHDNNDPLQTPETSSVYYTNLSRGNAIFIQGDLAYVASGLSSSIAIINISDPTNPGVPVYKSTSGNLQGIHVEGNYLYATGSTFFLAQDISDLTTNPPEVYGSSVTDGKGVYVDGNYAYVADYTSGLAIIDISIPSTPGAMIYSPNWTGEAWDVYVSGDFAYIAAKSDGLAIINVSDPTNPSSPVFAPNWTGNAYGVFVIDDFAYIGSSEGLSIVNISDPTNPGTPIHKDILGFCRDVHVLGDYAYLASSQQGLVIIDISDPTNPGTPIIEGRDEGSPYGIFVKGDYAYIATGGVGLVIVHARELFSPIITETPSDFTVDFGYTGKSVSWTATDRDAGNYTLELLGTGVVAGPTVWTNGTETTFNIPDGLLPGDSIFRITFTDIYDNSVSDSVTVTVRDIMDPEITNTPPDFSVVFGYTGKNISWTATDHTPNTYTITLEGTGVVAGPTAWSSGTVVTYDIPADLAIGNYTYTINFIDDSDNSATDSVIMTITQIIPPAIPYGNFYLIFLFVGIISAVLLQTRRRRYHTK